MSSNWNGGRRMDSDDWVNVRIPSPTDVTPGTVLVSPKGRRWTVTTAEAQSGSATYMMVSETGDRERRSYQNIRTWLIISRPDQGI